MDGDPYLRPSLDGGQLDIIGGNVKLDQTLRNAVYLSLFTSPGWWGNDFNPVPLGCNLEDAISETNSNKMRLAIIAYAENALDWLISSGFASSVHAEAVVISFKEIKLGIEIQEPERTESLEFIIPWDKLKEAVV